MQQHILDRNLPGLAAGHKSNLEIGMIRERAASILMNSTVRRSCIADDVGHARGLRARGKSHISSGLSKVGMEHDLSGDEEEARGKNGGKVRRDRIAGRRGKKGPATTMERFIPVVRSQGHMLAVSSCTLYKIELDSLHFRRFFVKDIT